MRTLLVAAGVHTLAGPGPGGSDNPDEGPSPRVLLVDGPRLAWVGSDPADAPPHDRAVDLGGGWVTPSFVDAHVHATATGLALTGLDLGAAQSLEDALGRLRRHAEARGDAVVLGTRWDDTSWPEGRPPTAEEVAQAAPGRTVVLTRVDAHSCVVDPGTLGRLPLAELEGVERNPDGTPTGWLAEQASEAAYQLVVGGLPPSQLAAARLAAAQRAASLGIGCLHEMGHPGLSSLDDACAWATGSWPVEVLVWWAELDASAGPSHGLRPGGDLFLDGSIGSRTAAVSCGYRDGPGTGMLFHDDQAVAEFFTAATAAGTGAGVHAIGDRAIEQAIRALEATAEVHGLDAVRHCRHRVEHLELPSPGHLVRLGWLGAVASVQPAFDEAWGGDDRLYERRFGVEAARASNPFAAMVAAGVPLAFGSDSTVTPLDPWGGVQAAVRHRGGHGIGRRSALAAHTLGGRYVAGQDDVGPLIVGARADLAVWDVDPFAEPAPAVGNPCCLLTLVSGRTTHGDSTDPV